MICPWAFPQARASRANPPGCSFCSHILPPFWTAAWDMGHFHGLESWQSQEELEWWVIPRQGRDAPCCPCALPATAPCSFPTCASFWNMVPQSWAVQRWVCAEWGPRQGSIEDPQLSALVRPVFSGLCFIQGGDLHSWQSQPRKDPDWFSHECCVACMSRVPEPTNPSAMIPGEMKHFLLVPCYLHLPQKAALHRPHWGHKSSMPWALLSHSISCHFQDHFIILLLALFSCLSLLIITLDQLECWQLPLVYSFCLF